MRCDFNKQMIRAYYLGKREAWDFINRHTTITGEFPHKSFDGFCYETMVKNTCDFPEEVALQSCEPRLGVLDKYNA